MATVRIAKSDGSIQSFDIRKVPSRGVQLARCVTMDGRILGIAKSGALYSVSGWPYNSVSYHGWTWSYLPSLANSLYKLGLITEADRDATICAYERATEEERISFAASQVEHYCQEAGIDLTKRQMEKISRLKFRPEGI